jgi:RecA-family ATPase
MAHNDRLDVKGLLNPLSWVSWLQGKNPLYAMIKKSLPSIEKEVVRVPIISIKNPDLHEKSSLNRGETIVFAGQAGIGKGHFIANILVRCILNDQREIWQGHGVKRVLYLTAEERSEEVYDKIRSKGMTNEQLKEHVHVLSRRSEKGVARLQADRFVELSAFADMIKIHQATENRYDVIVIDSLIDNLHPLGSENDNVSMNVFMGVLREMGGDDCLILLVAHTGKGDARSGADVVRGAGAINASGRGTWTIRNAVVPTKKIHFDRRMLIKKYMQALKIKKIIDFEIVKSNNSEMFQMQFLLRESGIEYCPNSHIGAEAYRIMNGDEELSDFMQINLGASDDPNF